jgi:sulfonate transport system ATP-binding protein
MLRLKKIGKQFPNGKVALREVTLEIAPRTIVSVVGTSGSGKSTLLRIVSGLEAPTTGDLTWNDQSIVGPRRDIGFIFQESRLMPWLTVTANVRLGLGPRNHGHVFGGSPVLPRLPTSEDDSLACQSVSEAIRKVGLLPFASAFPRELSGGMAQRVAIARALVARPSLILLDEPFSALDAVNRLQLQNHLLQIWQADRPTLLVVTHDVEEAIFFGDRVIVLERNSGRIKDDYTIGNRGPGIGSHRNFSIGRRRFSSHWIRPWSKTLDPVEEEKYA